ncbi:NEDD8-activating enzyme E1 catalytic subunit [Tritrichomonas foetus]|uniref:NEDD8-activating enzyme E1 catalytic subunit n=1 Tax=Tritrichomonas foetus TaxID=1144522 RepID=A0A1J4KR19_9EUKA|nr:NEDD8-activating enzyme E1 catalytic subunit [Tritrichomonas foetus]|eukprot:OHT13699.1 NEDD8-activating enzyme E1 catalytic subunit [Tritrichomonas foetus]
MISPGVEALLEAPGPFVGQYYASGKEGLDFFLGSKVLIIGAGGLGCELIKSLSLNGFPDIHIVDMDTIEVSNLNRQFLFRIKDVGRPKAEVAAEFIKKRNPNIKVTSHCCRIQELSDDFYKQFSLVIGGLDSLPARNWMSAKLVSIARDTNNEIVIPYIDGGTEAWMGHVKVIYPNQTACMTCQSAMFAQPNTFQECTLASTPRKPEHCISWAQRLAWSAERGSETVDGDKDEHIQWIMKKAIEHAEKFKIETKMIDMKFTRIVVKNTVAAIASTQAIIASMCATEALKLVTEAAPTVDNNVNFIGSSDYCGVNVNIFHADKLKYCPECGRKVTEVTFFTGEKVKEFIERLGKDYKYENADTLIMSNEKSIINSLFPELKVNLEKELGEFVKPGNQLAAKAKGKDVFEIKLK